MKSLFEYQMKATRFRLKQCDDISYLALGLCGEAGEVAEKIKKSLRLDSELSPGDIAKELGDVLWYLTNLADVLGYDLSVIADINILKLNDRASKGTLQGSGDDR